MAEARQWPRSQPQQAAEFAYRYSYVAEDAAELFQVLRYEWRDEGGKRHKKFVQRHSDGKGGWIWNTQGIRRVPFRLPELLEARGDRIYILEGEKDVNTAISLGLFATCNPGGAKKWPPDFAQYFAGSDIVIIPDNDAPGREHGLIVANSLARTAAHVRIVELPGLAEGGDFSDWVAAGGSLDELDELVDEVPLFQSPVSPSDEEVDHPEPANLLSAEPAPPFPVDFLPAALAAFACDQAARIGCPVDLIAIPALIIAATLVGKDFRMAPKTFDTWSERPCLWGGVIGPVGSLKTPALNAALAPVWRLQSEFQEIHRAELEKHKPKVRAAAAITKQWEKEVAAAVKAKREMPDPPRE